MPHGGWGVLASWFCATAYQRPGFCGRRLVGRIRCFFLRKKAGPFGQAPPGGEGWIGFGASGGGDWRGREQHLTMLLFLFVQKENDLPAIRLFFFGPDHFDSLFPEALDQLIRGVPVGDQGVDFSGGGYLDQGVVSVFGVIHQDELLFGYGQDPAL